MFTPATQNDIDENYLRHLVLNSIRANYTKFKNEYGPELVIAGDGGGYWRKERFPYYKASRKTNREESGWDWNRIHGYFNAIKEEIHEHFPYCIINIYGAEADDIIGSIVNHLGDTNEPVLIISADKDFKQLHDYRNVKQYSPIRKTYISEPGDAATYLRRHIMMGDPGDGIPNFLSASDCFVTKTRQKPLSTAKLDVWQHHDPKDFCDENMLIGYYRNKELIDLSMTPKTIRDQVIDKYEAYKAAPKDRSKLLSYFMSKRLRNLTEKLDEF